MTCRILKAAAAGCALVAALMLADGASAAEDASGARMLGPDASLSGLSAARGPNNARVVVASGAQVSASGQNPAGRRIVVGPARVGLAQFPPPLSSAALWELYE